MIEARIDDRSHTGRIILRPNASWSWRANVWLLYTLAGLSFTIGIGFMLMGAWLILPYSFLEMSVLALCIYHCVRQCNRLEVITVSEHEVKIESGVRGPEESHKYHRLWAKFLVKSPRHPWDPATVSIRSHGKEQEIGSFLSRPDKALLVTHLRRVVPA